MQGSRKN